MATTPKKTGSNSTAKGTTKRAYTPRSSSSARTRKRRKKQPVFSILMDSFLGRMIVVLLGIMAVLGLNFLLSMNRFDRFFMFLGIELILVVLLAWIRFVLHGRQTMDN